MPIALSAPVGFSDVIACAFCETTAPDPRVHSRPGLAGGRPDRPYRIASTGERAPDRATALSRALASVRCRSRPWQPNVIQLVRGMATKQKVQLLMPEMGESVTEGTVLEWHVSEGDSVEEGQTMVEVSTDKVDAEVPAPASGTVTKILVERRRGRSRSASRLRRSTPTAAQPPQKTEEPAAAPEAESKESGSEQEAESNGAGAARTGVACRVQRRRARRRPRTTPRCRPASRWRAADVEIVMPEMGESVTEGTVLEWHVSEGDEVEEGQTVVEVSTDKVDAEVPAPASGTITKILVGPDETVEVGKPLGEMAKGAAPSRLTAGAPETAAGGSRSPGARRARRGRLRPSDGARATPVARRAAQANGVDLKGVKGTGAGRQDHQVRRPLRRGRRGRAGPGRGGRRGKAAPRARGDARQGDGREPLDPDGDLVPRARRRHARRQAQGAQRGSQGARDEGQLHPPDRLGDRQGRPGVAGDGPLLRRARRQAHRDRAAAASTSASRSTSSARGSAR